MPGPLAKELRIPQVERLMMEGKTHHEIAAAVGVHRSTLERWLKKREAYLNKTVSGRRAIVFDSLVKSCLGDLDELGQMIVRLDDGLVATDAYGKRNQIVRTLARFFGIESMIRIQNIQNNLQLNDNRKSVTTQGPVQIIVEGNGGQFDPEYGQVRVDSPSADEINSSSGN